MSTNFLDIVDKSLLEPIDRDPRWDDSPLKFLYQMGPRQRGMQFEKIVSDLLTRFGHDVRKSHNTDYDRWLNSSRIEIKGSLCGKNSERFTFLQIRPNQEYDCMIFLCCFPFEINMFSMDKAQIISNIQQKKIKPQHGGNAGNSGTFCFHPTKKQLLEMGAQIFEWQKDI